MQRPKYASVRAFCVLRAWQEAPSIRAGPSLKMGDAEAAEAPAAAPEEAPPVVEFVPPSLEIAKAEGACRRARRGSCRR